MTLHYNFHEKNQIKMFFLLAFLLLSSLILVITFKTDTILDQVIFGLIYILLVPTVFVKYLNLKYLFKNFSGYPLIKLEENFLNLSLVENRSLNIYRLPLSSISTIKIKKNYIEISDRFSSTYKINNTYISEEDYKTLCNFLEEKFMKE